MGFLLMIFVLPFSIAYAQNAPGPQNPNEGPNTVTKYCYNGVCNTNMTSPQFNETIGQYGVGNYTNGIHLNQSHKIAIVLSNTCIKLEEQNLTSHCATYKQLSPFDNIKSPMAGKWITTPYYHREETHVHSAWLADNQTWYVMVDPNLDFLQGARVITVTENNFTWQNPDQNSTLGYETVMHVNRSVLNCDTATVAPDLWLVQDTINYLESGCTNTAYNDTQITYHKLHPFYLDTVNMRQTNWLSHFAFNGTSRISQDCIFTWVKCTIPSDPFHTHDKRFGW